MASGGLFATTTGQEMTLRWCAGCWDTARESTFTVCRSDGLDGFVPLSDSVVRSAEPLRETSGANQ